jgi:hypothetical protein
MNCADLWDVVRAAVRKNLPRDPWATTVDGKWHNCFCDQILDNCFCGTQEAFAYDAPRWRMRSVPGTDSLPKIAAWTYG